MTLTSAPSPQGVSPQRTASPDHGAGGDRRLGGPARSGATPIDACEPAYLCNCAWSPVGQVGARAGPRERRARRSTSASSRPSPGMAFVARRSPSAAIGWIEASPHAIVRIGQTRRLPPCGEAIATWTAGGAILSSPNRVVRHALRVPQQSAKGTTPVVVFIPSYLTPGVDRDAKAGRSAERSQVLHTAERRPAECMS
jgi:hypothetical protein